MLEQHKRKSSNVQVSIIYHIFFLANPETRPEPFKNICLSLVIGLNFALLTMCGA